MEYDFEFFLEYSYVRIYIENRSKLARKELLNIIDASETYFDARVCSTMQMLRWFNYNNRTSSKPVGNPTLKKKIHATTKNSSQIRIINYSDAFVMTLTKRIS